MDATSPGILAVLNDLFFNVKIADGAKRAGLSLVFAGDETAALGKLRKDTKLVVIDLNAAGLDSAALIAKLRLAAPSVPVIGFVSHVETGLRKRALEAGAAAVYPRSVFSSRLPELLAAHTGTLRSGKEIAR